MYRFNDAFASNFAILLFLAPILCGVISSSDKFQIWFSNGGDRGGSIELGEDLEWSLVDLQCFIFFNGTTQNDRKKIQRKKKAL